MTGPSAQEEASMHPADLIDQSQAILGVVNLLVGGYNCELAFTPQDCHGITLILSHVEDRLKEALNKL